METSGGTFHISLPCLIEGFFSTSEGFQELSIASVPRQRWMIDEDLTFSKKKGFSDTPRIAKLDMIG